MQQIRVAKFSTDAGVVGVFCLSGGHQQRLSGTG